MNRFFLAAAVALGVSGCSSVVGSECNPTTCGGCCDSAGKCQMGTRSAECGSNGASCVACTPTEVCNGACTGVGQIGSGGSPAGTGGDNAGAGGAASGRGGAGGSTAGSGGAAMGAGGGGIIVGTVPNLPGAIDAVPAPNPNTPAAEDGMTPAWPTAAPMSGLKVVPNRDSAIVLLPAVTGAFDYRIFRVPTAASVTTMGDAEQVNGTTLFCAGYKQGNTRFTQRELLRQLEVLDIPAAGATYVVEALDRACPFPGARATVHRNMRATNSDVPAVDRVPFSMFTEAEIRTRYGSLIINGHGRGVSADGGFVLAGQGPTAPPRVLARTAIVVTPASKATPRTTSFFDDFDGTSGPIVANGTLVSTTDRLFRPARKWRNQKWDFFTMNDEEEFADLSIEKGQLHVVLPDQGRDIFASFVAVPRKPAQLSDTRYLHITFEVPSNASQRRYWWLGLCGAGTAGQTFAADGAFRGRLMQTPFFYQRDGYNVSEEGWNCLQFFPRDGWPYALAPTNAFPQSDLRVMLNTANAGRVDSVVNVSPSQFGSSISDPGWFRQINASKQPVAPMLDDKLLVNPRTRFDVYVRRDRIVVFVDGERRLCNDFGSRRLTMAEGAVAFGSVLYHSTAERGEFNASYWPRTAQRYYLENTPYLDERGWDNMGFDENVDVPAFDTNTCYRAP
jgi:hypothetical protein